MKKTLLALYGLKWNPFSPEIPIEALHVRPQVESFLWRVEQHLVREGGFALVTGEPGMGKSVVLRLLADRLGKSREVTVGAVTHPQSNVADFYRELGDVFGVPLRPHNRWGGFKALRERWLAHLESTLVRPVLLVDEAQEVNPLVLSELRLLASTDFDSRNILSVVLAGDSRIQRALRREDLLPLGSRLRLRLTLEPMGRDDLLACLRHLLRTAGAPKLMTAELMATLCDHAVGNPRVLAQMAGDLLAAAAEREAAQIDEKLYFEIFAPSPAKARRAGAAPSS
jgi:type II secretory pathway predicted ATPase ExeA